MDTATVTDEVRALLMTRKSRDALEEMAEGESNKKIKALLLHLVSLWDNSGPYDA